MIILEKILIARSSCQREFEVTSAAGIYPSTMRPAPGDNDTGWKTKAKISATKSHTSTPEFSVYLKLLLSLINNLKPPVLEATQKDESRKHFIALSWVLHILVFCFTCFLYPFQWKHCIQLVIPLLSLSPPPPTPGWVYCGLVGCGSELCISVRCLGDGDTIDQGICFKMLQSWTVPRTCLSLFLPSASVWNTFSSLIFLAAYVVLCSQLTPACMESLPLCSFLLARQDLVLLTSVPIIFTV